MNKTRPQTLDLVPFEGRFGGSIARGRGEPASLLLQIVRGLVVELCGSRRPPFRVSSLHFLFLQLQGASARPQNSHEYCLCYQLSASPESQLDHGSPSSFLPSFQVDGYIRQQGNNKNEKVVNSKANLTIVPLVK
jgi:hypothetical protein